MARPRIAYRVQALALCMGLAIPPAAAQSVEQFYKGRTVTITVGTTPGGINDISARLVARHLPRFIPGNPSIVVQNMPGAGGLASANRLYNAAERDGSVLAKIERAVPQVAIEGHPNINFDPLKFTWLGSLSSYANDAYLLLVNASHPAMTVADLGKPGMSLKLGANRAGSSNLIFAYLAKELLGLPVEVVRGYQGAANITLAQQRGELDGQMIGLSSIRTGQRDLWDRKAFRPLVQFGRMTRLRELADVPTGRELTNDPGALAIIEFAELPFFMALPFAAPPGVPADRAAALQTAFMQMCKDAEFLDHANRLGLEISPIDGDEVRKLIARFAATPKEVVARYNELVVPKKN